MNSFQAPLGWMLGEVGERPRGVHPTALIGGPPESRELHLGDPYFPPVIAESALVNAFCTIDGGLHAPTRVGKRSFLMAHCHLGHDAYVGDDCELGAGVVLCGHVTVGDGVRIGGNAWVRPFITIGNGAVIGGGSVVVKDVPDGETWAGNPARNIRGAYTEKLVPFDAEWMRWWKDSRLDEHDRKYGVDELPPGGC